ncbi:MAG: helix-turn-helix domain-containing protein [Clostridiales bacterium]|nr:helix-turn-helix domain-containing protein [Clostridiales bacterium]
MARGNYQKIIAENIAALRRSQGMTQAGLAERLGYSDKSVSKWERGEGLPDILCLKAMADLFGVPVDYFLEDDHPQALPDAEPQEPEEREAYAVSHRNITLVSVAGTWLLAAIVSVSVRIGGKLFMLPLVAAVAVTALLLVIFNSVWGRRAWIFPTVTFLCWSVLFLLCWILRAHSPWLLMILGIPATVVVWLACRIRQHPKE